MWRMFFAYMNAALARLNFDNVVWVAAGELNRRKGFCYVAVFVDLTTKRVILATSGKEASFLGLSMGSCCGTTAIRRRSSMWPSTLAPSTTKA